MNEIITKTINCSRGPVEVSIGDIFNWDGMHAGIYEVIKWGENGGIYSPSGLGGTVSVWVKNEKGEEIEWCGDSVAAGIYSSKVGNPKKVNN